MTSLILVLALAQSHVYRWEDSHGTVHFSANPSERPKGTPIEVFELGPIEQNGLMPDPEPVLGPFTRSQWRAKFAEIVGRRAELRAANGLTTRRCNPRTVEVTAPGQGPTQTQMFIHDCPLSVQCSEGHWARVTVPATPPTKLVAVVQDCADVLVESAQSALTEGLIVLRADEEALVKSANQLAVPLRWREP